MAVVLVTGGAGYIGSHTVVELLGAGFRVVVVDNFSNSSPEALHRVKAISGKDFEWHELDLVTDAANLDKLFAQHKFSAVIHFAGLKAVGESTRVPLKYHTVNLTSTINLLNCMSKYGVRNFVFSSSATVYGEPDKLPITEQSELKRPTNSYGRTKFFIEEIMRDLHDADKSWNIALLRYFNPVGAHASGKIGEDPSGTPNNLMPFVTQVAIGKRAKVSVFGSDYNTKDGTGVRDYLHVSDLAVGHAAALKKLLSTHIGCEAYNLGTGVGYSVLEMIAAMKKASGKEIPYEIVARRPGDVAMVYADASKAKRDLGWSATLGLEDMCQDAWRWQSANPNGYNQAAKQ